MKVLIAGGGLAGTILARELTSRGVDVTLADPGGSHAPLMITHAYPGRSFQRSP